MIGLVGPSGAGKSTLINLICRFFDVADGAILADGTDIRSFPVQEYRKNIGIVLQDPFLFYGTVAENIAYGRPGATRQEIIDAARAANAHEFILQLTDGYDSLVGERGQALSGGERQRISIARALLIDPRILILDEATSSVDTETEREIQSALENLIRGRTTIAIAHRLSTLAPRRSAGGRPARPNRRNRQARRPAARIRRLRPAAQGPNGTIPRHRHLECRIRSRHHRRFPPGARPVRPPGADRWQWNSPRRSGADSRLSDFRSAARPVAYQLRRP